MGTMRRVVNAALQCSSWPGWRVPHDVNLVRVGVLADSEEQFLQLASAAVGPSVASYVNHGRALFSPPPSPAGQRRIISLARRYAEAHNNTALPMPCWTELSGERTVLDIFRVKDLSESACQLQRANAYLLLHSTDDVARQSYGSLVDERIAFLEHTDCPVVVAGLLTAEQLKQGQFGVHSAWASYSRHHKNTAAQSPTVYCTDFASLSAYGSAWHLLYKAQMSVLYPRGRLVDQAGQPTQRFSSVLREVWSRFDVHSLTTDCNGSNNLSGCFAKSGLSAMNLQGWRAFTLAAYARPDASAAEFGAVITEARSLVPVSWRREHEQVIKGKTLSEEEKGDQQMRLGEEGRRHK